MDMYNSFTNFEFDVSKSRFSPQSGCCSDSSNSPPKSRRKVNARERIRTQRYKSSAISVNSAFLTLRTLIPTEPQDKKLSKIEVLRLAKSYIEHLDAVVLTGTNKQPCTHFYTKSQSQSQLNQNQDLTIRTHICTFCAASQHN